MNGERLLNRNACLTFLESETGSGDAQAFILHILRVTVSDIETWFVPHCHAVDLPVVPFPLELVRAVFIAGIGASCCAGMLV